MCTSFLAEMIVVDEAECSLRGHVNRMDTRYECSLLCASPISEERYLVITRASDTDRSTGNRDPEAWSGTGSHKVPFGQAW